MVENLPDSGRTYAFITCQDVKQRAVFQNSTTPYVVDNIRSDFPWFLTRQITGYSHRIEFIFHQLAEFACSSGVMFIRTLRKQYVLSFSKWLSSWRNFDGLCFQRGYRCGVLWPFFSILSGLTGLMFVFSCMLRKEAFEKIDEISYSHMLACWEDMNDVMLSNILHIQYRWSNSALGQLAWWP